MAKRVWNEVSSNVLFWILTITSIILVVVSWIMPPPWQIHASVLQSVAELEVWGILYIVLKAVNRGADVSINHGNTTVEVNNPDKKEEGD